jgi:hypothetical protein
MTQVISQESYAALDNSSRVLLDLQILMEIHRSKTAPGLVILNGMSQEVAGALTKFGFNLDLLIKAANPALRTPEYFEEIINDFSQNNHKMAIHSDIAAMSTKHHYGLPSYNDTLWQQAIIETGFVYTRSPISGKSLRSNKSFVVSKHGITVMAYYFEDERPFFLFSGTVYGFEYGIFMPSINLCVQYYNAIPELTIADSVLMLCEKVFRHSEMVKSYLFNVQSPKTILLTGHGPNLGHHLWQELSGLDYLARLDYLKNIDYYIVGNYDYFNFRAIFEEIPEEKVVRIDSGSDLLFTLPLLMNAIVSMNLQAVITDSMTSKLYETARRLASVEFNQKVSELVKRFPIIWFGLRANFRKWVSQITGIVNIVNSLSEIYPNLVIVLDGWSKTPGYESRPNHFTSLGNKIAEDLADEERKMVLEIKRRLKANVMVVDLIDHLTLDKVIIANSIDSFVVPYGSGDVYGLRIANKPGVVHTNEIFINHAKMDLKLRENYVDRLIVAGVVNDSIKMSKTFLHHSDYECNWEEIRNELIDILNM